jgi:hypothetical protein
MNPDEACLKLAETLKVYAICNGRFLHLVTQTLALMTAYSERAHLIVDDPELRPQGDAFTRLNDQLTVLNQIIDENKIQLKKDHAYLEYKRENELIPLLGHALPVLGSEVAAQILTNTSPVDIKAFQ